MQIIHSNIIPLPRADIDTDVIIPAEFLTVTTTKGLGKHLFARLREIDADFPFNQEKYRNAQILVTRRNFGCGSSREHAAWALNDWGIQAVLAPSFADIFYSNALKNKIIPIVLDDKTIEKIFALESQTSSYEVTIDLIAQTVKLPGGETHTFDIDPYRKECLIKGYNDIDYLISVLPHIAKYEQEHHKKLFFDMQKVTT